MHESGKWKVKMKSCRTLSDPVDSSLSGSSVPWDFQGKSTGVGRYCLRFLRPSGQSLLQSLLFSFHFLGGAGGGCKSADRLLYQANYLLSELFLFPLISLNAQYF